MPQAVLALGSNVGNPKENLDKAVAELAALGTVQEVSPYILSKPEGYTHQDDFVNAVLILQTELAPMELLKALKALETKLGRVKTFPNGPRVLDLDILFYDDKVIFEDTPEYDLFIPHPRLQDREFVLKPLSYLLPDFIHPEFKLPVYKLYRELMKKKGEPTCKIL